MRRLFQSCSGLAFLVITPFLITAEPIRLGHKHAAELDPILYRRQATATPSNPLDVLQAALSTFSTVPAPLTTQTPSSTAVEDTPTTTTGDSPSTTSDSGPQQANIRVSVAQPSLCSESALQFSSAYSVPTGVIVIQTETGWGDEGSVWNISANDGVQISDMHVPCQGSACTGITGNTETDGQITQNPDGSWSMNVTATMQPSVGLFGNASGGNPVDGKYDLTITSTPPCALPVFQNCSGRKFDPSADQWNAYSTGDFLTKYLADNNINTLSDLLSKASTDFLPTTDAQGLICNPDSGQLYTCEFPSYTQCDSSSKDSTAGYLVVAATIRMSQLLSLLYGTINSAQGDMAGYITQIVVKFFQPQAEQEWQAIVTAVSSIVGLFTFLAIILDAFTEGAATGVLVAAIVGVQSALAAAANFKNGFEKQKPDATYLAIDGNYTQSVMDYARGLEDTVNNVWNGSELGPSGITAAMASGAWLSVPNPYNVTGIAENARDWLDNILVTSYINRVFNDADAYILFLPYGDMSYYGNDKRYTFTQDICAQHWANDPSWPYYATCDIPLNGKPGMAVVTRPRSEGYGSKDWTSKVEWQWASYKWSSHDMVASSVNAYAEHGFHYNLTNIDFANILNKGSQEAIDQWKTLPLSTPGLFNLPVCEIPGLEYVPGSLQVQTDVSDTFFASLATTLLRSLVRILQACLLTD
ncbi:MAG: hypothetical protein L6R41_004482 [Letrouitia leprolyta]|nr:MAG: hypothetical protein L6R41_004482 [Letrouitia leprolyta]